MALIIHPMISWTGISNVDGTLGRRPSSTGAGVPAVQQQFMQQQPPSQPQLDQQQQAPVKHGGGNPAVDQHHRHQPQAPVQHGRARQLPQAPVQPVGVSSADHHQHSNHFPSPAQAQQWQARSTGDIFQQQLTPTLPIRPPQPSYLPMPQQHQASQQPPVSQMVQIQLEREDLMYLLTW